MNGSMSFKGVGIILIGFLRKKSKPNDRYIFDDGNRKPRSLNFFFPLLTNMHRWCLNLNFHATSSKPGSLGINIGQHMHHSQIISRYTRCIPSKLEFSFFSYPVIKYINYYWGALLSNVTLTNVHLC